MSTSAIVQIYLAHLEQKTGLLEIHSGPHTTGIYLQRGRVVQAVDMVGLLDEIGVSGTGNLRDDLGAAIAGGVAMDQAFRAAALGIGRALALTHGQEGVQATFEADVEIPAGCYPLTDSVPTMLRLGFGAERMPVSLYRDFRPKLGWQVKPTGRQAKDFGTRATRLLRKARQSPALRDLVAGVGQEDNTWIDLELLLAVDAITLAEVAEDPYKVERRKRLKAKARALEQKAVALKEMPPLEALEIEPAEDMKWLTADLITKSFHKLATPFHPDQTGRMPRPLQSASSAVFSAYSDISTELVRDPARLKDEAERWACKARGEVFVSRSDRDEARACLKRAQGHEHYRQWENAKAELLRAVELDANERLYVVVLAFVLAVLKERSYADAIGDIAECTKRASIIPKVEGLFRTGRLYKMADNPKAALASYQELLQIVPDHLGAKREVRLLKRRLGL